jgi:hypothetical protein
MLYVARGIGDLRGFEHRPNMKHFREFGNPKHTKYQRPPSHIRGLTLPNPCCQDISQAFHFAAADTGTKELDFTVVDL